MRYLFSYGGMKMVIVVKIDNSVLDICKSFGVKNYSKLTKKRITDKNGHSRFVWVKNEIPVIRKLFVSKDLYVDNSDNSIEVDVQNIQSFFSYLKHSECPLPIKGIISKYNDYQRNRNINYKIKAASSLSTSRTNSIGIIYIPNNNSKNTMSSFFHELAHSINFMLGESVFQTEFTESFSKLNDAINEERIDEIPDSFMSFLTENDYLRNNVDRTEADRIFNEIETLRENNVPKDLLLNKNMELMRALDKELHPDNFYLYGNLCGILDTMSFGKLNDNKKIKDGHGSAYYTDINVNKSELLSDYISMSICSEKAKELFDNAFPKTSKQLNYIIGFINNIMEKHNG